MKTTTTTTKT